MDSGIAINVENLNKLYRLYDHPVDRLKESLHPLRKKYHKDFYALNGLTFKIKKGETIGIIGKNGAGKSTLLKIITGVLTPTSGSVEVDGKISALLELGAGFNPEMTGMENIYLNGTIMGYSKEEMDQKLDDILSFADIGEFINQPVKMYSSGMFARLAFAVSINVDPDILIVDEALAVGDLRFQLKCMDKFTEFRKMGKTILFVTHDINSVKRFCSHCIWIGDGTIKASGDTDTVTDMYLDYLKVTEMPEGNSTSYVTSTSMDELGNLPQEASSSEIARITRVKLLDSQSNEKAVFNNFQPVTIEIDYEVHEIIKNPVIGVAVRTIDHYYVCGLNTLLDHYSVKWEIGKNKCYLTYNNMNLIGGSYYIDVALFEQNAVVPIDYQTKVKTFTVRSKYVGEGIVILDHQWGEHP